VIVDVVLILLRADTREYKRSQLVEDSEFEPQFDTVKSAFECDLDVVKIGILGTE
jgi:hydroxymethylpyrimidine/phosphomethylpyrimidine kinase